MAKIRDTIMSFKAPKWYQKLLYGEYMSGSVCEPIIRNLYPVDFKHIQRIIVELDIQCYDEVITEHEGIVCYSSNYNFFNSSYKEVAKSIPKQIEIFSAGFGKVAEEYGLDKDKILQIIAESVQNLEDTYFQEAVYSPDKKMYAKLHCHQRHGKFIMHLEVFRSSDDTMQTRKHIGSYDTWSSSGYTVPLKFNQKTNSFEYKNTSTKVNVSVNINEIM